MSRTRRMVRHRGATLLPGLIDAHVHLRGTGDLEELARWGVTTALDMGSWPPGADRGAAAGRGLTDVRSTGAGAVGPGSLQAEDPRAPHRQHCHEPGGGTPVRRGPDSRRCGLHQGHRGPARPRRP